MVTPLTRFIPRSLPMPKRINISAKKPNTVVAAEAAIETNDCFMAFTMADSTSGSVRRRFSKAVRRKIA